MDELVQEAVRAGARLVSGGRRPAGPGNFYEPTILADCPHRMRVVNEEVFGGGERRDCRRDWPGTCLTDMPRCGMTAMTDRLTCRCSGQS